MSEEHTTTNSRATQARSSSLILAVIVAVVSGGLIAIQGNFNGAFTSHGGGPLLAGWVSYVGTFITVLAIMVVQRNVATFWHILRTRSKLWWYLVGFGGVPIVVAMSWGIPLVGVAIGALVPLTPLGAVMHFTGLPPLLYLIIALEVVVYLGLVEFDFSSLR